MIVQGSRGFGVPKVPGVLEVLEVLGSRGEIREV
jgi:hypothetical protein